uniref:Pleiotrophin/Midkine N-terminal domain-containing protein n=1 Tax=Octopus bimaculoides TaxID=37653 RepID=A0A0L8IDT5_OCTBM
MTRLFPFCFLFLIALTAIIEANERDCNGCLIEGRCHKFGQKWMEKTDIMCARKQCRRMSQTQWKVLVKKVYCRQNNGRCVGKNKTWPNLEDGECWTHRCHIKGGKRVEITSKLGGKC